MFGTRQITGYIVFVICRSLEGRTRQLLDEIGLFCDDKVTKLHTNYEPSYTFEMAYTNVVQQLTTTMPGSYNKCTKLQHSYID